MKRLLCLAVFLLCSRLHINAQDQLYTAYKETALTSAVEKITVQQPANASQVRFDSATIYCSVACDATLTQNGSAATVTSLAVLTLNMSRPAVAVAFSGSDSTGGKTLDKYSIPAGQTLVLDLSKLYLSSAVGQNLSVGISSITGTARVSMRWSEK